MLLVEDETRRFLGFAVPLDVVRALGFLLAVAGVVVVRAAVLFTLGLLVLGAACEVLALLAQVDRTMA